MECFPYLIFLFIKCLFGKSFKRIFLILIDLFNLCVDFNLRNQTTKINVKIRTHKKYPQNCQTLFIKPGFRYWVSLQYSVFSCGLWDVYTLCTVCVTSCTTSFERNFKITEKKYFQRFARS